MLHAEVNEFLEELEGAVDEDGRGTSIWDTGRWVSAMRHLLLG